VVERGERGPTGDHGQDGVHGERGEKGDQGDRGPTNKLAIVGYLFLAGGVAFALTAGYLNDRAQCRNAKDNREVLRELISNQDPLDAKLRFRLTKKDPAYDYYVNRPEARMGAHIRSHELLRDLVPPIEC
jgi:hypothetical protein